MPDMMMCRDWKCPLWRTCLRFLATPSRLQSYFSESPRPTGAPYLCGEYALMDLMTTSVWKRYVEVRIADDLPGWGSLVTTLGDFIVTRVQIDLESGERISLGRRFSITGLARAGAWRVGQFIALAKRELEGAK